jgi:hypothetical protein
MKYSTANRGMTIAELRFTDCGPRSKSREDDESENSSTQPLSR